MFEGIINFFKKSVKKEEKQLSNNSKSAAKERLHLVLMQDRANVSADFLELMKQEIIDVIKKYIEVDEKEIDVRLTKKENEDGTNGAPALYANIPILNIKNDARKIDKKDIENKNNSKENQEKEQKNVENKEEKEDIDNNIIIENDEKDDAQAEKNSETKENKQEENEQKEEVKSEN